MTDGFLLTSRRSCFARFASRSVAARPLHCCGWTRCHICVASAEPTSGERDAIRGSSAGGNDRAQRRCIFARDRNNGPPMPLERPRKITNVAYLSSRRNVYAPNFPENAVKSRFAPPRR
jgi:hypothetical protein